MNEQYMGGQILSLQIPLSGVPPVHERYYTATLPRAGKYSGSMKVHVLVIEILRAKSDVKDNPGKNNVTEDPENQEKPENPLILQNTEIFSNFGNF
jgi:hypothetical protein